MYFLVGIILDSPDDIQKRAGIGNITECELLVCYHHYEDVEVSFLEDYAPAGGYDWFVIVSLEPSNIGSIKVKTYQSFVKTYSGEYKEWDKVEGPKFFNHFEDLQFYGIHPYNMDKMRRCDPKG